MGVFSKSKKAMEKRRELYEVKTGPGKYKVKSELVLPREGKGIVKM